MIQWPEQNQMLNKLNKFKRKHKIAFALVIGFAVVAFWRGAWGILDIFVFPNDYAISSIVSLIVGVGLLTLTDYIIEELI